MVWELHSFLWHSNIPLHAQITFYLVVSTFWLLWINAAVNIGIWVSQSQFSILLGTSAVFNFRNIINCLKCAWLIHYSCSANHHRVLAERTITLLYKSAKAHLQQASHGLTDHEPAQEAEDPAGSRTCSPIPWRPWSGILWPSFSICQTGNTSCLAYITWTPWGNVWKHSEMQKALYSTMYYFWILKQLFSRHASSKRTETILVQKPGCPCLHGVRITSQLQMSPRSVISSLPHTDGRLMSAHHTLIYLGLHGTQSKS